MDTFGQRVRAAMLAAGLVTAPQLGKRCQVSRQTAQRWMDLEEADLSAKHLVRLSRSLGVRITWFMTGEGELPRPAQLGSAATILNRLSSKDAERWLAIGRRMMGKE